MGRMRIEASLPVVALVAELTALQRLEVYTAPKGASEVRAREAGDACTAVRWATQKAIAAVAPWLTVAVRSSCCAAISCLPPADSVCTCRDMPRKYEVTMLKCVAVHACSSCTHSCTQRLVTY